MKKIIGVAAIAVLAACSPAAETEAEPEEAAVEEAAAEVMAADGGTPYGNFKVTSADGSYQTEEVREDGTFTSIDDEGVVTTGTWVQKPGEYCNTSDEEGAIERCHTETVDENGVWTSVDPEGETVTVERLAD